MKTLKRSIRDLSAVLVAVVLLFGATQAIASAEGAWDPYCPGVCPPLTPGVDGTCWELCESIPPYVGDDCEDFPNGDCCCFEFER